MKDLVFKTLMLKGEPGGTIASIEKTGTSGNVDTYTITLNDGSTTTFEVSNGSEIVSLEKTGTSGNVDTYTLTYNTGETFTFTVTNANVVNSLSPAAGVDREANAPSIKAVNDGLSASNTYADGVGTSTLATAKQYTDSSISAETIANRTEWTNYADGVGSSTLATAKQYTDGSCQATLESAQQIANGRYQAAVSYTNTQFEANAPSTSKKWTIMGNIVESPSDNNFQVVGSAVVIRLSADLYQIDFSFRVTSAGTVANNYNYGVSLNRFRQLDANVPILKFIVPPTGGSEGIAQVFKADGTLETSWSASGGGWQARPIDNKKCGLAPLGSAAIHATFFQVGMYCMGTCYALPDDSI